jgi:molecular chaperone GrpE
VTAGKKPPRRSDEGVVFLEGGGKDDLARALEEAERAVAAVEEKRRHQAEEAAHALVSGDAAGAPPEAVEEPEGGEGDDDARLARLAGQVAHLEERLVAEQEESGKLRSVLLRKTADFENLKKRTEREKADFYKFALAEVFDDLLGVLDNFERALQHLSNPDAPKGTDVHVGIEMIARQMGDVLKKYGLAEVPALGLPFDPNVHEAVLRGEEPGAQPGIVLGVLQKGYLLNNRLLRPAKVKVAAPPQAPTLN